MRFAVLVALLMAGCASGTAAAPDADPNAPPDAEPPPVDADLGDCDPSTPALDPAPTWYGDGDGDGHGDAAAPMVACEMPADHVALDDDCDDGNPLSYPGLTETCDGLDNDCNTITTEVCPGGCVVRVRPDDQHRYLFCTTTGTWTVSSNTCIGQSYRLVRLDDAAESAWVRTTANEALGANEFWIGGGDGIVEGTWIWTDGAQFWAGTSGGSPVGLYTNWESGEPNNDGAEDCGEARTSGQWNDVACTESQRFVCERY